MGTKKLGIYKCNVCGNIVEVLNAQAGELVCCGQAMKLMNENTVDASLEKHIPVAEITPEGIKVRVGNVEHPMIKEHYIEWVELLVDNRVCRAELEPEQKPEVLFPVKPETFTVRAYCNLHGLWKGE
ncbi:MAG: desulfoferrodoxin [Candidatus Melainabacteria bacterium GWF2_37_15]|nr:MAG: desulfoferrodoxin [Candidatus Melainabacteria bacterium GWF2_37_15]